DGGGGGGFRGGAAAERGWGRSARGSAHPRSSAARRTSRPPSRRLTMARRCSERPGKDSPGEDSIVCRAAIVARAPARTGALFAYNGRRPDDGRNQTAVTHSQEVARCA